MPWYRNPLILIAVIVGLLALGAALRPIVVRKAAHAKIDQLGGTRDSGAHHPPSWYWKLVARWQGELRISEINMDGLNINEKDLTFLKEIRELNSLNLRYVDVSDEFLARICSGLGENLFELDFRGTQAGDKTARAILDNKNLVQLQSLNLVNTQVSDPLRRELEARSFGLEWGPPLSEQTLRQVQALWPAAELTHLQDADDSQIRTLTVSPRKIESHHLAMLRAIEGEIGWLSLKWAGDISPELAEALTYQKTVRGLSVSGRQIDDLSLFHQFKGLKDISISGCTLVWTPQDEPLLPASVRNVGFGKMWWMSEGGIGTLLKGSSVTHLNGGWQETKHPIKDEHLAGLGDLPLQELRLEHSVITDTGLTELVRLKELQVLDLGGVKVTSEGLPSIGSLLALDALYLDRTDVADKNLGTLSNLKQLRILSLDSTAVTDAGVRHLIELSQLESLTLAGTSVSSASLPELLAMSSLRQLELSKSGVSKADWLAIAKSHPSWSEGGENEARKRAHYPQLVLERTD